MKDNYSILFAFIVLIFFGLFSGCTADGTTEASESAKDVLAQASATKELSAVSAQEAEANVAAEIEAKRLKDEQKLEELKAAKKELEEKLEAEKLAEEKEARAKKRRAKRRAERKERERLQAEEAARAKVEPVEEIMASGKGKLGFEQSTFNFGKVDQGDRVNHEFKFYNTGTEAINVTNVSASCGCTRPSYPFLPIEPGKSGVIGVTFDTKGKLGRQKPSLTVNTDGDPGEYKIFLEGFVDSGSDKN